MLKLTVWLSFQNCKNISICFVWFYKYFFCNFFSRFPWISLLIFMFLLLLCLSIFCNIFSSSVLTYFILISVSITLLLVCLSITYFYYLSLVFSSLCVSTLCVRNAKPRQFGVTTCSEAANREKSWKLPEDLLFLFLSLSFSLPLYLSLFFSLFHLLLTYISSLRVRVGRGGRDAKKRHKVGFQNSRGGLLSFCSIHKHLIIDVAFYLSFH